MNINTIALILFIIWGFIALIMALKSAIEDFKTQEGCAGCNGVCTTNGGYCPRRRDHKPKPDRKMLWEMADENGKAGNLNGKIIAVCCNNQSKVTSFGKMRYLMLYYVNRRGIDHKKLMSLADISQEKQIGELKKNRISMVLAARVKPQEQEMLRQEGIVLSICYDQEPDKVIDTFFSSRLKRAEVKDFRLLSMFVRRIRESYKTYPGAPLATALRWISTTLIYGTLLTVIICAVAVMAGQGGNLVYGTTFFAIILQAVSAGIWFKAEDIAKKNRNRGQNHIGVNM